MPPEISVYQTVDFRSSDWKVRLAKSIAIRFERDGLDVPQTIRDFLGAQSVATGRREFAIKEIDDRNSIIIDYFTYTEPDRYFDFVNAAIQSDALAPLFDPSHDPDGPVEHYVNGEPQRNEAQTSIEEFFRFGDCASNTARSDLIRVGPPSRNIVPVPSASQSMLTFHSAQ